MASYNSKGHSSDRLAYMDELSKCNNNHTMTPVDVTRAIARLKLNKHDHGYMGHYGSDTASIDLIHI